MYSLGSELRCFCQYFWVLYVVVVCTVQSVTAVCSEPRVAAEAAAGGGGGGGNGSFQGLLRSITILI